MSFMFFATVLGVTSEMKNRLRSSFGSCAIIRIMAIMQYVRMNTIPIMNGRTKSL